MPSLGYGYLASQRKGDVIKKIFVSKSWWAIYISAGWSIRTRFPNLRSFSGSHIPIPSANTHRLLWSYQRRRPPKKKHFTPLQFWAPPQVPGRISSIYWPIMPDSSCTYRHMLLRTCLMLRHTCSYGPGWSDYCCYRARPTYVSCLIGMANSEVPIIWAAITSCQRRSALCRNGHA